MKIQDLLGWTAVVAFVGVFVYMVFVAVPIKLYTEAECLRKGYPESRVTVGLERYCMNLDGSVIVKVVKQ